MQALLTGGAGRGRTEVRCGFAQAVGEIEISYTVMRSIDWAVVRGTATRNMQAEVILDFDWKEHTVAQWDADLAAIGAARLLELQARVAVKSQAETLDNTLAQIESASRRIVRLAKTHYRKEPVKLAMFDDLTITAVSRDVIIKEGREVHANWSEVEGTWKPAEDLVNSAFGSLIAAAESQLIILGRRQAAWRHKAKIVEDLAQKLDELNVAWYSDATTELAAGTVSGDLVRTVPTTYNPPPEVGQAVLSNVMTTPDGTIHFDAAAPHATKITYLHKGPGMEDYEILEAHSTERSFTYHHALPGLHLFKAFGENSAGHGEDSATLAIEVQARANAA